MPLNSISFSTKALHAGALFQAMHHILYPIEVNYKYMIQFQFLMYSHSGPFCALLACSARYPQLQTYSWNMSHAYETRTIHYTFS
jgi:hypothetical protein